MSVETSRAPAPKRGAHQLVARAVRWARVKSPWLLHYNSGGCNGCDIEFLDLLTPRYDVERLGIKEASSPRHADILVCMGPVTRQSRQRLLRIYEQIPAPKWVVAVGSCACSGGIFQGGYSGWVATALGDDSRVRRR